jgi:hypothetical protein
MIAVIEAAFGAATVPATRRVNAAPARDGAAAR